MRTPPIRIAAAVPFAAVAFWIAFAAGRASTQPDPPTVDILLAIAAWCLAVILAIAGSIDTRRTRDRERTAKARATRAIAHDTQWAAIVRATNPDTKDTP